MDPTMDEETRQLLEMEESECSSSDDSSDDYDYDDGIIITEAKVMPSLLQSPRHRLETICENDDTMMRSVDGGSLSSAALTLLFTYGLLVALVMGFVATVVATAPGKLSAHVMMMRNKKDH